MMRSLYSGVSGLKVHQTKMDVIGNNIANVNTVGFKSSTVRFSDVFYQTTQSATGPNEATGAAGSNAMQIGLGANVASITASITETGGSQRTDNPFDIMINGDAFFIVKSGGTNYFTKAGAFNVDANGNLCTYSGAMVMGWGVDPNNDKQIQVDTVKELRVMSGENLYSPPEATKAANIYGNINQKDETLANPGRNLSVGFYDNMGNKFNAKLTIKQVPGNENNYTVGLSDVTNDVNGKSIFLVTTVDPVTGQETTGVNPNLTTVTLGGVTYTAQYNNNELSFTPSGTPDTLSFSPTSGKFVSVGQAGATLDDISLKLSINPGGTTPDAFEDIDIDFSPLTQYSANTSVEAVMGTVDGNDAGKKVGNMTGISIDAAGKIFGRYDNGDNVLLGQIAVTTFSNPTGLEAVGDNMFAATQNSGEFNGIGQDPTAGGGSLTTGVLEMSNVDLSAEFTEMITTQRGFQANSRIITTSDSLLEELINLKR